jgi:tetratricopeptide (TPR) repeat protein
MKDTTVRTAARTLVPFLLLLASCASPRLNVLTGNYRYSRGEYPQAVIRYFEAVEKERYLAFLAYNLGNAYYALGESLAAVETLEGVLAEASTEAFASEYNRGNTNNLLFRTHFNLGVVYFEQGLYEEAVSQFIEALRIRPGDLGTKIDLEVALKKLDSRGRGPETEGDGPSSLSDDLEEALRFVQEKEKRIWRSLSPSEQQEWEDDW